MAKGSTKTSGLAAAALGLDAPSSGAATGTISAEAEFRERFPMFSAALDAWKADHQDDLPTGVRIKSSVDGFRRAGIVHSKAPVEHPIEAFTGPDQLEALFAEPALLVELIAGVEAKQEEA